MRAQFAEHTTDLTFSKSEIPQTAEHLGLHVEGFGIDGFAVQRAVSVSKYDVLGVGTLERELAAVQGAMVCAANAE